MSMPTSSSNEIAGGLAQQLHTFEGCARLIVAFCTLSVLIAVFLNFLFARRKGPRAIRTERKSIVETGSMLGFFVAFYFLVKLRFGVVQIPQLYYVGATIGLLLLLLGTIINIIGRFELGRNWGNQVLVYEDHTLVTRGIYRVVRHPLYAGLIWMFLGAAMVFQNLAALLATVLVFMPAMYYRAKQEEKALVAQFPNYREYRNTTGMFFPISMGPEVVQVPKLAFAFCRISLTVLLWLALALNQVWLVAALFCILLVSVLLKVHRSPMVQLYQQTVLRVFPSSGDAFLDVPAMRFAHGLGALMSLAVTLTMLAAPTAGWYCLAALCVIKTISAVGFCPASKLFVCMRNGGCCALTTGLHSGGS
jgi:protein-S-isoprenylcysteine O-methyltransferase Ste14